MKRRVTITYDDNNLTLSEMLIQLWQWESYNFEYDTAMRGSFTRIVAWKKKQTKAGNTCYYVQKD